APVRAERMMDPAETWRMLLLIHRLPRFPVVLVGPHRIPECPVIGGDHATLAPGGHDLVLAEGPRTDMPDAAHCPALVSRAMGLGTLLDHIQLVLSSQRHDRIHVARPASQMDTDDG